MKSWFLILLLGANFLLSGIDPPWAAAKNPGNCLECHSQKFALNGSENNYGSADIENRNVYQARLHPCPGVRNLAEETFFTESRIVTLNRMAASLDREGTAAQAWKMKVAETHEAFSAMKNADASVSHFAKGTAYLRAGLQKIYDQAFRARGEADHRWLIGLGGIILVVLLVFVGVGYGKLKRLGKSVFLVALLAGSFSLSACTQNGEDPKAKSQAQERLDQARGVAAKLTAKTEDSFSAAILLAGLARDWAMIDPASADKAFQLSWKMALQGREVGKQTSPLKKVAELWPNPVEAARQKVNYDAVLDLRDEIKALEGRTWALRAIAEQWYKANPQKGREALESAFSEAKTIINGEIRDIECKTMAEAWTGIDEKRAIEAASSIQDPFLQAISFAAMAKSLRDKEKAEELLQQSWKLAGTVSSLTLKIYAFCRISAGAANNFPQKKEEWAGKVHAKIKELRDPLQQVYGYQELVSSWASIDWKQTEIWASEIPLKEAEARVYSLIQIGGSVGIPKEKAAAVFKNAIAEAEQIKDTFQAQKTRTLILLKLASLDPQEAARALPKIEDPILRSEVEMNLVNRIGAENAERALQIAGNIPDEFGRWKSFLKVLDQKLPVELDRLSMIYQRAEKEATAIGDPYSRAFFLIELGKSWGRIDRSKEAAVYDLALKTAWEIPSPSLKAEAWEALAAAWRISNKAKAQSILEKIDENVLSARRKIEEVRLWAKTDSEKAKQIADAIPAVYVYEKSQAFKEIAGQIKTSKPSQAVEALEKAWQLVSQVPDGGSRDKKLSLILSELSPLNLERAFALVRTVPDRRTKDILLQEPGNSILKEGSSKAVDGALKIAEEISDSMLRASLYQKIADLASKGIKGVDAKQPNQIALVLWGQGRETAKREETRAIPYFERAFQEIGKISAIRERAYILAGLIRDWTQIDEEKALKAAETISSEFAEPLSYSLMQVSLQLWKWNRQQAETVFQKTLTAARSIQDPSLRAQRFRQIAEHWRPINKEREAEVLKMAESLPVNPQKQAFAILDSGKEIYKERIEGNLKLLEKAYQYAQGNKNPRVLTEVALIWSLIDPAKAQEILSLIDSKDARVKALQSVALRMAKTKPDISSSLFEKAVQEAESMDRLQEKIPALRGIAGDWASRDPGKAKAAYRLAYQAAERMDQTTSKF